jgi:uncharacterized protein YneF (UPF0154 family)
MARLIQAKTPEEIQKVGVKTVRDNYNSLASDYNRIVNNEVLLCPKCNSWIKSDTGFYADKNYATGRYPICKKCLMKMVEQKKSDRDEPNETKDSVKKVLQMMDRVYDDSFYEECIKGARDKIKETNRNSPFSTYIVAISSLPQWQGKTWADSDFGDVASTETDVNENSRIVKSGKKRFGKNYTADELYWLENEYQDWIARYSCESKAQENLFKILCQQELERENIRKNGANTKDIDKSIQDTMNSLGIKPSQSNMEALADNLSFGQLLEQWEKEKPVPEPQGEFKDPDRVGTYIDVFFKGHLAKMMGLRNGFSKLYDKYMEKYTVTKPEINEEEEEALFNQIFGTKLDEDGE